jgi:hypothetical protein
MNRSDQLAVLAQICTDNNVTPQQGNYAVLIRKICATHLYVSEAKTKELTRSLTTAYYTDRWSNLLNPTEEHYEYTTNKLENLPVTSNTAATNATQERTQVHEAMMFLTQNSHPEPPKKVDPQPTPQQDNLTEQQIAQIFYGVAQRETSNNVGRIILSDARDITDNKHLSIQEVHDLWIKFYPVIEAEIKSNVLMIYWGGKCANQNMPYIQPRAPVFRPKHQEIGDIYEDDTDVVPEQENP